MMYTDSPPRTPFDAGTGNCPMHKTYLQTRALHCIRTNDPCCLQMDRTNGWCCRLRLGCGLRCAFVSPVAAQHGADVLRGCAPATRLQLIYMGVVCVEQHSAHAVCVHPAAHMAAAGVRAHPPLCALCLHATPGSALLFPPVCPSPVQPPPATKLMS